MMTINSKDKGNGFERDAVKKLNLLLEQGVFKRIPGSGAIGTNMNEPFLTGDITGEIYGMFKPLKGDCKVGYGGKTQVTFKKDWLDKIRMEAKNSGSFPFVLCKFSGARVADGTVEFVALDLTDFISLMNFITNMRKELDVVYERLAKDGRQNLG
jgi:Holliday junction resolvase